MQIQEEISSDYENPFGLEFSTQTKTNLSQNKLTNGRLFNYKEIHDENTQFRNETSKHPYLDKAKTKEKYKNIGAKPK